MPWSWRSTGTKRLTAGARSLALYWLQGQYDALTIVEAADEDEVMALLLAIGAEGSLRTETMRGYSIEDLARMLSKLPQ